jgi:diguanylate cyclase (GGDEF)-like protein
MNSSVSTCPSDMIDPATALIFGTLMMLLNGALLGLMHKDFPEAIQPAAKHWRIGTLLMAGGTLLLATQRHMPETLVLPLGNSCLVFGLLLYWRALQKFYGVPQSKLPYLLLILTPLGVWCFTYVYPQLSLRTMWTSAMWIPIAIGCCRTLLAQAGKDRSVSRKVLIVMFVFVTTFMIARGVYFGIARPHASDILDPSIVMNMISPALLSIVPVIGTTSFLLLITDRIKRDLEFTAATDALTLLPNRRTLVLRAQAWLQRAQSQQQAFALLTIDVDRFKSINDQYGHDVGDRALIHVAQTLAIACPKGSFFGRYGGEEFILLLLGPSAEHAHDCAESLRIAVRASSFYPRPGLEHALSVSIGLARAAPGQSVSDLLRAADHAMYQAKAAGRDCVRVAD